MIRFALVALLAACGKGDDEEDTDAPVVLPGPDTARTDTGGGENDTKVVMEYSAGGWFAYDATSATVVPFVDSDGDALSSYFYLEFRSEDYSGSCNEEDCCYVYVLLDGYTGETFATDAGYAFGFHIPQGEAQGFSSCIDNGFDPADPAFGGDDPFVTWSDPSHGWGVTIGGAPSVTVTEWAGYDTAADFIGGQFLTAGGGSEGTLYFLAYALDASMQVLDTPIAAEAIVDENGALVTGYYLFDVMVHFDPIP